MDKGGVSKRGTTVEESLLAYHPVLWLGVGTFGGAKLPDEKPQVQMRRLGEINGGGDSAGWLKTGGKGQENMPVVEKSQGE